MGTHALLIILQILIRGLGLKLANYQSFGTWNGCQCRKQEQILHLLHSLVVDDVTGRSLLSETVGHTTAQYFQTITGTVGI